MPTPSPRRDRARTRLLLAAQEARTVGRQARQVGILAVATGLVTGLVVAVFDRLVAGEALDRLLDAPGWVQAGAPLLGLAVTAVVVRVTTRSSSTGTADEYIKAFHDPGTGFDLAPVPGRTAACATTLGSGVTLGFEGPAIYLGAAVGTWLHRRAARWVPRLDPTTLLVCGAAAGVAAVFKAPATGLVFALEVPFRQDLARRMLLPAMFASAAGYVVFVGINGTAPLFAVGGAPPFDLRDLGGAALLGLACGLGARGHNGVLHAARRWAAGRPVALRVAVGGAVAAGALVACRAATGLPLTLGAGYDAIAWTLDADHPVGVVALVAGLRVAAMAGAVFASGAGGLFVLLAAQGALAGGAVGTLLGSDHQALFPLLGMAAFLGGGYRVPLAAVVFVAETTGRPGFVVPGLIAAACSQVLIGASSAAEHQVDTRQGPLERRLALPLTTVLRTEVATVAAGATVDQVLDDATARLHQRWLPVLDGDRFVGVVTLSELLRSPRERWTEHTLGELVDPTAPVGQLDWSIGQGLAAMEGAGRDHLAVLDGGRFAGLVAANDVLRLDALLDGGADGPAAQ